jgi:hypothetical protein
VSTDLEYRLWPEVSGSYAVKFCHCCLQASHLPLSVVGYPCLLEICMLELLALAPSGNSLKASTIFAGFPRPHDFDAASHAEPFKTVPIAAFMYFPASVQVHARMLLAPLPLPQPHSRVATRAVPSMPARW